ncbi:hypothetical protein T12_812 [Trichinella patagoniensis]|uniref:Uncharacterized protein n=1 Tax=Trichinella patagoniensis TaxID=990121 RepID=A0A0V0ZDA0_9BILA|nr:hypothetical protein T12_812 [Trichinella patagoniensis]
MKNNSNEDKETFSAEIKNSTPKDLQMRAVRTDKLCIFVMVLFYVFNVDARLMPRPVIANPLYNPGQYSSYGQNPSDNAFSAIGRNAALNTMVEQMVESAVRRLAISDSNFGYANAQRNFMGAMNNQNALVQAYGVWDPIENMIDSRTRHLILQR